MEPSVLMAGVGAAVCFGVMVLACWRRTGAKEGPVARHRAAMKYAAEAIQERPCVDV